MPDIPVSLSTICGGILEDEFQDAIQQVVAALKEGQKGSISINIQLQRMPDTSTIVTAAYTLAHKLPATKKASVCLITDDFHLKTEDAPKKPENVVSLFKEENGNGQKPGN